MNKIKNIIQLAENRVEQIFREYPGAIDNEEVIIGVIGLTNTLREILDNDGNLDSQIKDVAIEFLKTSFVNNNAENREIFESRSSLSRVSRSALVGLAAASIGATTGLLGQELHPILVGIVGAESAILLNVLASFLIDSDDRKNKVDGLDLAVLSVLGKGHYTAKEIANRISENIEVDEIQRSIEKLKRKKMICAGNFPNTYKVK